MKKLKVYSNKKNINQKNKMKLFKKISLFSSLAVAIIGGTIIYENRNTSGNNEPSMPSIEYEDNTIGQYDSVNKYEGLDVDLLPGTNYYRLNSLHKEDLRKVGIEFDDDETEYDLRCNLNEFASIMGNETITWDDLQTILNNNKNIPDDYKEVFSKALKRLEKANVNIPLAAAKHNLSNLTFKKLENFPGATGMFKYEECCMYLDDSCPEDVFTKTIVHELMHAMYIAYATVNERKILCSPRERIILPEYNMLYSLGNALDEGYADYLTSIALDEKIDCNNSKWSYAFNLYNLLILSDIQNFDINNYPNVGIYNVFNEFAKKGDIMSIQGIENIEIGYNQLGTYCSDDNILNEYNMLALHSVEDILASYYVQRGNEIGFSAADDEIQSLIGCYSNYIEPVFVVENSAPYTIISNHSGYGANIEYIVKAIDDLKEQIGKTY